MNCFAIFCLTFLCLHARSIVTKLYKMGPLGVRDTVIMVIELVASNFTVHPQGRRRPCRVRPWTGKRLVDIQAFSVSGNLPKYKIILQKRI